MRVVGSHGSLAAEARITHETPIKANPLKSGDAKPRV